MKIFNKKIILILCCFVLIIVAVKWKQSMIKSERNAGIVSSILEWKNLGTPVVVEKIESRDVLVHTHVTVRPVSTYVWRGFVPQDVNKRIKVGQHVAFDDEGNQYQGEVTLVSEELNVNTGMYKLEVKFKEKISISQSFLVCSIVTGKFVNVINIDSEKAQVVDGKTFVWISKNNVAIKKEITILSENGYGLVVESGLDVDDLLIVEGQSKLDGGDRVQIVDLRNGKGEI